MAWARDCNNIFHNRVFGPNNNSGEGGLKYIYSNKEKGEEI
jgi:hypothetical protein